MQLSFSRYRISPYIVPLLMRNFKELQPNCMNVLRQFSRFDFKCLLIIGFFSLLTTEAWSTHLRAGNILVKQIGDCSNREYEITIIVYTNTSGTSVLFGGDQDYLDFGDGSPIVLVPEIGDGNPNFTRLGPSIARASYTIRHKYGGPGRYTISYVEPNRNGGIQNMSNSVNTTFYIETQILIDPFLGCSTPPTLEVEPIDRACVGAAWFHNPGASDPDNSDSISYEMVIPFRERNTTVAGYVDPNNPQFYGSNYQQGNEASDGPPIFKIDSRDGTITWDAPGTAGEYNIAFNVVEWRKFMGRWHRIGYVRRDMQIIVEGDCRNKRPELEVPDEICVVAGEKITAAIKGFDPDGDSIKIEGFSPIFDFTSSPRATLTPTGYRISPSTITFDWQTNCDHVKDQPYLVVFKITDKSQNGVSLASYKTVMIRVVGPPPVWDEATLDVQTPVATLKWDAYACYQADNIQIWRKVDGSTYDPECETGLPESLGYEMIATVPASQTSFVDSNKGKGLAPGAKYCYRLVAVYTTFKGGLSMASQDICVGPVKADKPIITNVSILKTSTTDGEIEVKWAKPLDIDPILQEPFIYRVYRSVGFTRGNDSTLVGSITSSADIMSIVDNNALNTSGDVYSYTVYAVDFEDEVIGSSALASSVRVETGAEVGKIVLTWRADVPWTNNVDGYTHKIYRGEAGSTEDDLVEIAQVDVTTSGFTYVDEGQHNGIPLGEKEYCYRIETFGRYGNLDLPDPLQNFSQIVCVMPGDEIPPCTPLVSLDLLDCGKQLSLNTCDENTFFNRIVLNKDNGSQCQDDVRFYRIYRSSTIGGDFVHYKDIDATVTEFLDRDLTSYAMCYKVSAVDRSGNESELSQTYCNDNCPQYVLPNVFTPNNDSKNDYFSAYSLRTIDCSGEGCVIPQYLIEGCARFVESVKFRVFNRWGQHIYSYQSGGENTIYIDWNGVDDKGNEVEVGTYYYVAEVIFKVVDPKKRHRTLKGYIDIRR
jgi:hypothetical protein